MSQKIAAIAESATLKIDAKAKALKAAGRPIISYAAGEPDFVTPAHIVEAAAQALKDPANYRYTQAIGLPQLRAAIARKTQRDSGLSVDPAQIIVTNGGKHAVYTALQVLLNPGDEVILPAPYWVSYLEQIQLADGVAVPVFAAADQGYKVTVAQLEAARTPRTKVLMFCSPNNPTGAVYTAEETAAIGQWALEHDLLVISDEIYQNLNYSGDSATSILQAVPELANNTILVNGVAKTYAMTGWRIGWLVAPADLARAAANLQSHMTSNINNVAQVAAQAALDGPQEPIAQMREAFKKRRELIVRELSRVPGFVCPMPDGAFYAYVDVQAVIGREIGGEKIASSLQLADVLLEQAEVAAVPGEAFGGAGYLRFSYALGEAELVAGIQRVQKLLAQ